MAKKEISTDDVVISDNPLMRAEVDSYVKNSKKVSLYTKISEYMFWGATTVLAGVAAGVAGILGIAGLPAVGIPLLVAGGVASVAAFIGSVFFSRAAADVESHNSVIQSDIDSQNQAHRMVQAFAKVQATDKSASADEVPFIASARKNWSDRVGQSQSSNSNGWAARVEADRQVEEQNALAALQR